MMIAKKSLKIITPCLRPQLPWILCRPKSYLLCSHSRTVCKSLKIKLSEIPSNNGYLTCQVFHHNGPNICGVTLQECIKILAEKIEDSSVSEPEVSAEYIVAYVCGKKNISQVSPGTIISSQMYKTALKLGEKRLKHMPIQYVLGEWDFRETTLKMRPPVFIPRPETEELVSHCLTSDQVLQATRFLEIGCGSGAISISLLKHLPHSKALAIDQGEAACNLTLENAYDNNVADRLDIKKICFTSDVDLARNDPFDFIISNPPYIPSGQICDLAPEITGYEDRRALDGGVSGMDVVIQILQAAPTLLKPRGSIWLEVDTSHPETIKRFTQAHPHLRLVYDKTIKDFLGNERFCQLHLA